MKNLKGKIVIILIVLALVGGAVAAAIAMPRNSQGWEPASAGPQGAGVSAGVEVFSVAEAEARLGAGIPLPAYLPGGCQAQRIFVYGDTVQIYFSNKPIPAPTYDFVNAPNVWQRDFERAGGPKFVLKLTPEDEQPSPAFWQSVAPDSIGTPGGEMVELGVVKGILTDPKKAPPPEIDENVPEEFRMKLQQDQQIDDVWLLMWWHSGFRFRLMAPKQMSQRQLIKIAASVPVLSSRPKALSLEEAASTIGLGLDGISMPSGYSPQRAFSPGDTAVYLLISNEPLKMGDVKTDSQLCDVLAGPDPQTGVKMILCIDPRVPVAPRPEIDLFQALAGDDEILDLGGTRVVYSCEDGYNELKWLTENTLYSLKAAEEISLDELSEIVRWVG